MKTESFGKFWLAWIVSKEAAGNGILGRDLFRQYFPYIASSIIDKVLEYTDFTLMKDI